MFQQLNILHHIPESYEALCVQHMQRREKRDTGMILRNESLLFDIKELLNWGEK